MPDEIEEKPWSEFGSRVWPDPKTQYSRQGRNGNAARWLPHAIDATLQLATRAIDAHDMLAHWRKENAKPDAKQAKEKPTKKTSRRKRLSSLKGLGYYRAREGAYAVSGVSGHVDD